MEHCWAKNQREQCTGPRVIATMAVAGRELLLTAKRVGLGGLGALMRLKATGTFSRSWRVGWGDGLGGGGPSSASGVEQGRATGLRPNGGVREIRTAGSRLIPAEGR